MKHYVGLDVAMKETAICVDALLEVRIEDRLAARTGPPAVAAGGDRDGGAKILQAASA